MRRIDCINKITTYAARFVVEVEGFNASGQYHINIHAENFLIPVLNEIFHLQLENLNATQKKNFPAVDLADFKNRVAFQITATADSAKVKSTVESFFDHKLDEHFDTLYIYIITQKKDKYPEQKINNLLPDGYVFNTRDHIIDKDDLLQRVNAISATPRLEYLAKLYEHEFSDMQIQIRKTEFELGYLNNEPEDLYPNLLPIEFPTHFYIADLNIDEEGLTQTINTYLVKAGKMPVKKIRQRKLVIHSLKGIECKAKDWILHENALYTFKNLNDPKELLRKIVDIGTITSIACKDFYTAGEDNMRVFKYLLRSALMELCLKKGIEWFGDSKVFRFANNPDMPNKKQVKWKGKNEATKTVIFEMINKKEGHIICYRHLAFRAAFEFIGGGWFLSINPTWSFTNPHDGYRKSRYESGYMSGLKRLENNASIYNYFRFFGYHLTYTDLFTEDYPYLKVSKPFSINMAPRLEDKTWRPVKISEKPADIPEAPLEADTELNKTLFD